jgi:hypothetical protein
MWSLTGLKSTGVGLIWYGQNYLIYPSAFPPGSRIGESELISRCPSWLTHLVGPDVATPADYDLPYIHLDLKTEDDVTLKCYLLVQRKKHISASAMTEEEVVRLQGCVFLYFSYVHLSCSLYPRDQRS